MMSTTSRANSELVPLLEFAGVTFAYGTGQAPVLRDVSFTIAAGELVFLTGASGAGKTSLLRLIYRAAKPTRGRIMFNGRPINSISIPALRRQLGIVFQDNRLLNHKTAGENVAFAGEVAGLSPGTVRVRARELLERVGLGHKIDSRPTQLSAGERQRVAIARALMNRPRLLLADEPTGNLDPVNAQQTFDLLASISETGDTACFIATHALALVDRYPARVLHLANGRLHELSGG